MREASKAGQAACDRNVASDNGGCMWEAPLKNFPACKDNPLSIKRERPQTVQVPYDDIADQWDGVRANFGPKEAAYLGLLLQDTPTGSGVLDLGCGTGLPNAQHVVSREHCVVGVDSSSALLALEKRYVHDGEWVEADLAAVDFEEWFAAVVCWDVLFHIERKFHGSFLEKIHRWLLPGGRRMLSSGGSDFDLPGFTDAMFGHEVFYDVYLIDQMVALVKEIGFAVVLVELPEGGRNKGNLAVIACRRT